MSRIPNPFLSSQGQQQQSHQGPSSPGFLVMTRPPTGSNSYGGSRGIGRGNSNMNQYSPTQPNSSGPPNNFIPFSANSSGSSNSINQESDRRGSRGNGGKFNRGGHGGGRNFSGQGNARFAYPYQQSPSRMNSPYSSNQGFPSTPRGRDQNQCFSNTPRNRPRDRCSGFSNTPRGMEQSRFSSRPHVGSSSKRGRDRGPLSDVPIDKFISQVMVQDPWAEFDDGGGDDDDDADAVIPINSGASPKVLTLDDSEIIIDSDASVVVENSYEEGVSGTEGDSSPAQDTESESPYIVTSSTSEKDTGSDSTSDA